MIKTTETIDRRACPLRVTVGQGSAPLFTWTSAMACWSWSLPAGSPTDGGSCASHTHARSSVCHSCYALIGRYSMQNVIDAQRIRFQWLIESMPDTDLPPFLASAISTLSYARPYFRIHDSGDFHNTAAIDLWTQVVTLCPRVRFWSPTRSWRFPTWLPHLRRLHAAGCSVRPSALNYDEPAPVIDGLAAGSSVAKDEPPTDTTCPKLTGDSHNCEAHGCRQCWDNDPPITYPHHGYTANPRSAAHRIARLTINTT